MSNIDEIDTCRYVMYMCACFVFSIHMKISVCVLEREHAYYTIHAKLDLPRFTSSLHLVGQRDVVGPNVVLPLPESENSAQNSTRVNADAHVQLNVGCLDDGTGKKRRFQIRTTFVFYDI